VLRTADLGRAGLVAYRPACRATRQVERNILRAAQAPTLLRYGQHRMGKTSILNQLPALLGSRFLPVLVDCQAPAMAESPAALLRYLSRCLAGTLNTRLGIVHEDVSVRRARGAEPLELEALRSDGYSLFEDWLDAFQTRLSRETHLLLCLDEFERLQEPVRAGWGIRFLDGLRHRLQHRPLFALMFTGSRTFEQLGPVWTDRFLSARRLKVSFLEADDVRQLLTRPTPTFQLTYAPGALERIMEETRGQPSLTQVLASELVHRMNRLRRKEATIADVEATIDDAVERSAEFFANLWFSRNEDERAVLRAAASGDIEPPTSVTGRALCEYDLLDDHGRFLRAPGATLDRAEPAGRRTDATEAGRIAGQAEALRPCRRVRSAAREVTGSSQTWCRQT
jgi:hypothetical protein